MKYLRRHHIGLAALFIALGGTSYAAVQLPKNSVGANQIKAGAVGSSEIKNSSVTAADVKNGSLTASDFKAGQLPKGDTGATGATGPQGPKGDKGETGPAGPTESIAVRLNRTGNTTIPSTPNGTATTQLTWTEAQVAYEVGGDLFNEAGPGGPSVPANAGIRIPKAGTYSLSAGLRWKDNSTGARALSVSGPQGSILATSIVPAAETGAGGVGDPVVRTVQNVSTTTRLNEGDYVYVSAGQNSGAPLDIQSSLAQVHFAVTYVGP